MVQSLFIKKEIKNAIIEVLSKYIFCKIVSLNLLGDVLEV